MRSIWPGTVLGVGLVLGSVGLLRGSEPPRPELASLVERLGSPKFSEREEATEAIREIGASAVEQLKQARESGDPEIRARSQRLLEAIEREAALAPSMIRLPRVPADLEAVIHDLDSQTDFPIRTTSDGRLDPEFPVNSGDRVTFWQAVDRLGLEPSWSRIDPFRNLDLPVERPHMRLSLPTGSPASVWNDGPFRVSVKEGRSLLQERFGQPADASHITLDFDVDIEPKLTVAGRPQITLTEAVDSDGNALLLDGLTEFVPLSEDDLELSSFRVEASLNRVHRHNRTIARLRGVVEMEVEVPTSEQVEISLDANGGALRTVDLDGLRVTLLDSRLNPLTRSLWVDLLFEPSDWAEMLQNRGFRGRRSPSNVSRVRLLQRLSLVDDHGNPVPRVETRIPRSSPIGLQVSLEASPTIDDRLPAKLLISSPMRVPVQVEFDFKNVAIKPVLP